MSRLLTIHELVGQLAKTTPDMPFPARGGSSAGAGADSLMIRCLTESASSETTAGGHRHDMIVARFEEFLESEPRSAAVSDGDLRGDRRGGAKRSVSLAWRIWE